MKKASRTTAQKEFWTSSFAKGYVDRNFSTVRELDRLYTKELGITRTNLNREFLKGIKKDARILEVGTNIGVQLLHLRGMGFTNLYGIEVNPSVAKEARRLVPDANIITGDALDIPFKDGFFDLVFTSRVLIHISPKDIRRALKEVTRVSRAYVWGLEYYEKKYTEIPYHGHRNVLWKTDFPKLYQTVNPALKLIKRSLYPHVGAPSRQDVMFLFRKSH
jgi:pseudaminic acid biosynthesis-associated methylase